MQQSDNEKIDAMPSLDQTSDAQSSSVNGDVEPALPGPTLERCCQCNGPRRERGLCGGCYYSYRLQVNSGRKTWAQLEREGRSKPPVLGELSIKFKSRKFQLLEHVECDRTLCLLCNNPPIWRGVCQSHHNEFTNKIKNGLQTIKWLEMAGSLRPPIVQFWYARVVPYCLPEVIPKCLECPKNAVIRGLCETCYDGWRRLIIEGITTWELLESLGRARPWRKGESVTIKQRKTLNLRLGHGHQGCSNARPASDTTIVDILCGKRSD